MLQQAWVFVGVVALVVTLVALFLASNNTEDDDAVVIVSGVLGFVSWGVWTYGSLNVVVGETGEVYTMPSLTILGVALALIPGILALTGPIEIISRATDTGVEDV